jgi:hypothetical protein
VAAAFVAVTASIPPSGLAPEVAAGKPGTAPAFTPSVSASPAPGVARGVLIGDSVALTLGAGFERVEPRTLEMKNASVLGCGVIRGDANIGGRWYPNAPNCDRWSDSWAELIQREQAQVAVAFWGAWDMYNRRVSGEVMRWGTPELDRFLTSELDHAVTVLASTVHESCSSRPRTSSHPTSPAGPVGTRACSSRIESTTGTNWFAVWRRHTRIWSWWSTCTRTSRHTVSSSTRSPASRTSVATASTSRPRAPTWSHGGCRRRSCASRTRLPVISTNASVGI